MATKKSKNSNETSILVVDDNDIYVVIKEGSEQELSDIKSIISDDYEKSWVLNIDKDEYDTAKNNILTLQNLISSKIQ